MKYINLPNLLTLGNLTCGLLAMVSAIGGNKNYVLVYFLASLLFDLFDGLAARALKISSPVGKELDSLADVISFGALPGLLLYELMGGTFGSPEVYLPAIPAFLYPAAAALRLAKFNTDTRQSVDFMGLNTPAASIAIVGLYLADNWETCTVDLSFVTSSLMILAGITVLFSILLLVDLPMLSFKPTPRDRGRTLQQVIFLLPAIILLIWLGTCAIPFLILWYIFYSIILYLIVKRKS